MGGLAGTILAGTFWEAEKCLPKYPGSGKIESECSRETVLVSPVNSKLKNLESKSQGLEWEVDWAFLKRQPCLH